MNELTRTPCPICGQMLNFTCNNSFFRCKCKFCGIEGTSLESSLDAYRDFKQHVTHEDSFFLAKIAAELRKLNNFLANNNRRQNHEKL